MWLPERDKPFSFAPKFSFGLPGRKNRRKPSGPLGISGSAAQQDTGAAIRAAAKQYPNKETKEAFKREGGSDLEFAAGKTRRFMMRFACAAMLRACLGAKKVAWRIGDATSRERDGV